MRGFVGLLMIAWLASCTPSPYVCTDDVQCVDGEVMGRCEPQGFCSFPDVACPSGARFEPDAGDDLGGTCVPEINLACGAVGSACCDDGSCIGNAFCDGGTCAQCVVDVAPGGTHTCFLRYDSTIWCAGENTEGQLGNGGTSTLPVTTPVQVRDITNAAITDAIALGTGGVHSCAIRADNTVWCWGRGRLCDTGDGLLGNSSVESSDVAVQVVRQIDDQPLTDIVAVSASFCHSCALDMTGNVWCWGANFANQLGDGTTTATDAAVRVLVAPAGAPFGDAVQLSVGADHNCVRTTTDDVFCWGNNAEGQIGDGTQATRPSPTRVTTATAVELGEAHTCALEADGTMQCWGNNDDGQLGNGEGDEVFETEPTDVLTELGGSPFGDVAQIAVGDGTCALTNAGAVFCWSEADFGETGNAGGYLPSPVLDTEAKPLVGAQRIVHRFQQACAFLTTGELVCWGKNQRGELGDGTVFNRGLATPGMGPTCP